MAKKKRTLFFIILAAYIAALLYFTIFAEALGRIPGPDAGNPANCNLIPFNEIKRYIIYRKQLGLEAVFLNIFGNFAAFIPAGILIPIVFKRAGSVAKVTLSGFLLSLIIECSQYIFKVGSLDVDDMILNTLGVLAGAVILRIMLNES